MSVIGDDTRVAVGGGTPGADSNDYVLFDSTTALFGGSISVLGINRGVLQLNNAQAGTLKSYFSVDKGANWDLNSTTSVGAGAGITGGPYDFEIVGAPDWKLVWTNGGSAQTTWRASLTLSRQKASGI